MGSKALDLEAAGAIRTDLAAELSRRDFMSGAVRLGIGAGLLGALPASGLLSPSRAVAAAPSLDEGILQAFYDTLIPGRVVTATSSGAGVYAGAILGVDKEPGAVEADALALGENPNLGFTLLAPALLAELETRALTHGGEFISLGWDGREATLKDGLAFSNPTRQVWEAGAAVAFTAFCAAATIPNATSRTSVGYRVMGHPGVAPHGYKHFSYRKALNRGRTRKGNLR